jgi:peptidyl-prolyl cis-trans isomerase D
MIRFLQKENRLTKAIFWVVIGAAAITMVITLVPGIFANGPDDGSTTYATVRNGGLFGRLLTENSEVSTQQVQRLASRMIQQQKLPDFLMPYMMQRAATSLVQQEILIHEANRLGLQVTDDDLRRELQTGSFGQYIYPEGKFIGDDRYAYFVSTAFNMSTNDFESTLKKQMELERLERMVTAGVTVNDKDVRKEFMEQGTKVKFDYAVISLEDIKKQINPTDAQLEAYFNQHAKQYAKGVPETRKIAYIVFDPSQTPGSAPQVTDAALQAYYQQHMDQFQQKEQVKVRHILIKVPQGADAATDAAAKKKADDIRKQLQGGADFAKLAKENSDDPGSKDQGGELGMISRGQTVPEFEQAAFSLQPGQLSQVIKTQFGYHILQVEAKQAAQTKSLDQVKDQIRPIVQREAEMQAAQKFAQQLATQAQQQGLEKAAAAHSLHVETTDYLQQGQPVAGIPDSAAMLTAAFQAKQGAAPQSVSTGEGYAVFSVVDIKAAHAPSFAEYKTHVLDDFRNDQAPALLQQKTSQLAAAARAGNDLAKAAKDAGATVQTSDVVGRDGQVPGIGSLAADASQIFGLSVGQVSGPLNNGRDGFVVKVDEKQEPSPQELAANFDATRDKLLDDKRERMFGVFVTDLQQRYEKEKRILYNKRAVADATKQTGGPGLPAQPGS